MFESRTNCRCNSKGNRILQKHKLDMKRVILNILLCIFLGVCETSCYSLDRLVMTEQPSRDGKITVRVSVDRKSITVTIINTSSESIAIDKEMVLLFEVDMYDFDGNRFFPDVLYDADIHKNVTRVNSSFDTSFNAEKIDLNERIVILKPGESVSRVYDEHDNISCYQFAASFEGRSSISKYKWEIPKINKIAKIVINYNTDSWNRSMPDIIANYTNKRLPAIFYRGEFKAELEVWKNLRKR